MSYVGCVELVTEPGRRFRNRTLTARTAALSSSAQQQVLRPCGPRAAGRAAGTPQIRAAGLDRRVDCDVSLLDMWAAHAAPILLWVGPLLAAAILAGLAQDSRWRLCLALPLFLAVTLITTGIVGLCAACATWDFWIAKELLHAALLLLMGLELGTRLFRGLPYSHSQARRRIAGVLVLTAFLLATAPRGPVTVVVLPRLLLGLAWLYMGLWLVVRGSRLSIEPLHSAVLGAFTPYLLVYAVTWARASEGTAVANVLNPVMSTVVLVVLLLASWRGRLEPAVTEA